MKRIALALLVFAACSGDSPTSPDGPVPFTQVYAYHYSGIRTPRTERITNPARWAAVWAEMQSHGSPQPPLPSIDFDSNQLILAALGNTADACKAIAIAGIELRNGILRVDVKESRPPTSCSCPPVTVQPVHVVAIGKVPTKVAFEHRSVTEGRACN